MLNLSLINLVKINKLTMLKGKMLSTIEINKVKIEGMQKKNRGSRFTNKTRRKRPCSK